jgi:hypothetical protein
MSARRIGWAALWVAGLLSGILGGGPEAGACSCPWHGPFLVVASEAPLIVRGRVLGQTPQAGGPSQAIQVEVLERFRGAVAGRILMVWGDDGWLCRVGLAQFRVGTEWILALDGPGSKPGTTPGHAVSVCGQHVLRVEGETVRGPLEPWHDAGTSAATTLAEFRARLGEELTRGRSLLSGEVAAGQGFERGFGPGLLLRLEPMPTGWMLSVRERGRDEELSRLTPPLHSAPNPRDLEGWQFCAPADHACEAEAAARNAPGRVRDFIFSPEVGRTIQGPEARRGPGPEDIHRIMRFGRGRLRLLDYRLAEPSSVGEPKLAWIRFDVQLSWPNPGRGK